MINKECGITEAAAAATGLGELVAKRIAPISDWTDMGGSEHFVQFYESDEFIINSVAEYIIHGLKTGETCIVVATGDHLAALSSAMGSFGSEFGRANADGRYIALDAVEILSRIVAEGRLDTTSFSNVLHPIIAEVASRGTQVRVFGEMVGLLCARGDYDQALKLENLWNDLRQTYRFSLFCAYPISSLDNARGEEMAHICGHHTRVIPGESYTALTSANDRLRKIACLQQKGRQLEAEIAELERRISARPSREAVH